MLIHCAQAILVLSWGHLPSVFGVLPQCLSALLQPPLPPPLLSPHLLLLLIAPLAALANSTHTTFDFCQYGTRWRKRTKLVAWNMPHISELCLIMFGYQPCLQIETEVTKKSVILYHEIVVYSSTESDIVLKHYEHLAIILPQRFF